MSWFNLRSPNLKKNRNILGGDCHPGKGEKNIPSYLNHWICTGGFLKKISTGDIIFPPFSINLVRLEIWLTATTQSTQDIPQSQPAPPVSRIKTQIIDVMYLPKGLESWGDLWNTSFILVAKMVIVINSQHWVIDILNPCKLVYINPTSRLTIQLTSSYHFRRQIYPCKGTAGHQKVPKTPRPMVHFFGVQPLGFFGASKWWGILGVFDESKYSQPIPNSPIILAESSSTPLSLVPLRVS